MSSEETNAERVPCTLESVVLRLKNLDRVRHRVCDDGDGRIDDWPDDDPDGPYVEWERIEEVIAWIEQNSMLCLNNPPNHLACNDAEGQP